MHLSNQGLLVIIVVGVVAGYLAGRVMEGGGFGLIGDLLVGLVGAFIGDWLMPQLGIHLGVGIVALIINAFVGAVVLLLILRLVSGGFGRRRRWLCVFSLPPCGGGLGWGVATSSVLGDPHPRPLPARGRGAGGMALAPAQSNLIKLTFEIDPFTRAIIAHGLGYERLVPIRSRATEGSVTRPG
jgi:uncharacterized membrane protein YeaQ/YmgE (transglycosylase-associated protein family)